MKSAFVCTVCQAETPRFVRTCAACGRANTIVPAGLVALPAAQPAAPRTEGRARVERASAVAQEDVPRIETPWPGVDRVLGGEDPYGLAVGSVVLFAGEPGAGKSTLLAQLVALFGTRALYASGEENTRQVAGRFARLGLPMDLHLVHVETLDELAAAVDETRPAVVVVDSVQTLRADGAQAGTTAEVKTVTERLQRWAKETGVTLLLVGHITKDGAIAGPKALEHLVDAVLVIEGREGLRIVRAIKNRFGVVGALAVLEMTAQGLVEVDDPSAAFLAERPTGAPGSVVTATVDGARGTCTEVQALVGPVREEGTGQRSAQGVDASRVKALATVLAKHTAPDLVARDVLVSVVGGRDLADDRAVDLALAAAILSSAHDRPVPPDVAFLGELGLAGEVRGVSRPEVRAAECARVGLGRVVGGAVLARAGVEGLVVVRNVAELDAWIQAAGEVAGPKKRRRGAS